MKLQVLYFASLREAVGCDRETLAVPPEVRTVGDVRAMLTARGGHWATALAPTRNVRAALNQRLVPPTAALVDGAELAFFPPVTGG